MLLSVALARKSDCEIANGNSGQALDFLGRIVARRVKGRQGASAFTSLDFHSTTVA